MEITDLPKNKKIILFDGVCNLCDTSVRYIIEHDKKDVFRFASLQSELGQKIISHIGIADRNIDSIVLYEPGTAYYYKAEAIFRILMALGGIFNLIKIATFLPKSLSDWGYDYVAKNRYKWYGKKEKCMIPTPEQQAKFLE